jgi:hypothetical protein
MTSKDRYQQYLTTDYWKAVSDALKKRDGYRCRLCNSQHDLTAHHRTYDHRGNELDYLEDLTCLCRRCHEIFHGIVKDQQPKNISIKVSKKRAESNARKRETCVDWAEVARDMPLGDTVILTQELINKTRTSEGGFTSATVIALRPDSTEKGWVSRLCGKSISADQYREALVGRYIYNCGVKVFGRNKTIFPPIP